MSKQPSSKSAEQPSSSRAARVNTVTTTVSVRRSLASNLPIDRLALVAACSAIVQRALMWISGVPFSHFFFRNDLIMTVSNATPNSVVFEIKLLEKTPSVDSGVEIHI